MPSTLEQLQTLTTIVADTGDIEAIKAHRATDATTNPSLLYKAIQLPHYKTLLTQAIAWARKESAAADKQVSLAADKFAVLVGKEIIDLIPGKVSTEVDARLSFDTGAMIAKARKLIDLYNQLGIDRERVLIKIASTWEGIKAAEVLQQEGINCNLTLLFSLEQAVACADAKVFLISPFVGRIMDWHKKKMGKNFEAAQDPGVLSVTTIYNYYKQHQINTIVMGASFRNTGEIIELAGCDRLTISPALLAELTQSEQTISAKLRPTHTGEPIDKLELTENKFRYLLNANAMATEKLAEGIRNFVADQEKLEAAILLAQQENTEKP
ncbi:MAG: transaldolase [Cellvibrionaceae bacterium]|nr:transaldolase [Cellvibrionaceae bacterium]